MNAGTVINLILALAVSGMLYIVHGNIALSFIIAIVIFLVQCSYDAILILRKQNEDLAKALGWSPGPVPHTQSVGTEDGQKEKTNSTTYGGDK